MEHEVDIQVTVTIDGLRHVFDVDADGWSSRGTNQTDPSNLSFEIMEAIQRSLFDGDGNPRVEGM